MSQLSEIPRRQGPAAILCLFACWFFVTGCGKDASTDRSEQIDYLNWADDAVYVGREACRSCHPDKYETFIQSQMGRSWKKAQKSLSDADFADPEPVYAPNQNLYYQPFTSGEDLFVREYRIAGGDTVHNRVEQIDYIVGSGQHTNSHIWEVNGYLYQIPITWYVQDGKWDLAPGFASRNSRFGRPIPEACMTCHNGKSPAVPGSENRFSGVAEGIGCERCHGPGSVHIESIARGQVVDTSAAIDRTIVNPAKLSNERQWDLCSRCHMQGVDVFRSGVLPDDFRPGRALSDYQNVYWPRQVDSVAVFNMASHPDRLSMSKCLQSSRRSESGLPEMTCTSCHDPHVPIESLNENHYTDTCQSCHISAQVPACTEPTVMAGTATVGCVSCHMPESGTDDIPHVRITDHFIRVVEPEPEVLTEDEAAEQIRIIRMASLIDKQPDATDIALGFMSYYEKITDRPEMLELARERLAEGRGTRETEAFAAAQIWYWYLTEDYYSIRRYVLQNETVTPTDAWTQFRVGTAFRDASDFAGAIPFLERAVELAPDHLRFKDRLATAYTNSGEFEDAIAVFDEILLANPKFEDAVNNRGYAFLVQGRFEEAEADFKTAIDLNPDAEVALANLASLYYNTERRDEAKPLIERLLQIDPENQGYNLLRQALNF